jgi:hypothetical protein
MLVLPLALTRAQEGTEYLLRSCEVSHPYDVSLRARAPSEIKFNLLQISRFEECKLLAMASFLRKHASMKNVFRVTANVEESLLN